MAKTKTKAPQTAPLVTRFALWLISLYQLLLSPLLGPRCRFYPSCSQYAQQAITHHGFWRGGWLSLQRLAKCHPGHCGGLDTVPDANKQSIQKKHRQLI